MISTSSKAWNCCAVTEHIIYSDLLCQWKEFDNLKAPNVAKISIYYKNLFSFQKKKREILGKCNRMGEIKSSSCTQYTSMFLFQMHAEHSAFFLKFTFSFMKFYFSPGFTTLGRLSFQSLLLCYCNLYHTNLREYFCCLGVQRYYSKTNFVSVSYQNSARGVQKHREQSW